MLLTEVHHALFGLKDLLLGHALESLGPVLVHVDLESVQEVLGFDVRSVFVEDVSVFDIWLAEHGLLMCLGWWNGEIVC